MKRLLQNLVVEDRGLEMVEYAMLVALIILAAVGAVQALVGDLQTSLHAVINALSR